MTNAVNREGHSNAESLLSALELRLWTNCKSWTCPWVFRGQRDASWDLTPSAWRNPSTVPLQRLARLRVEFEERFGLGIRELLYRNPLTRCANADFVVKAYAQGRAEFSLLLDFVTFADELGHRVPDVDIYRRLAHHNYLPDVQSYPLVRFLPELNAAAALAQHHGVPTRSLDWTRNPLYAAYFAASEVEVADTKAQIAIWAIRPDLLLELGRHERYNSQYTRFLGHTVPNSENPYLRSQQGLFIHPVYGCAHIAAAGTFPDFQTFALDAQSHSSEPVIRVLTLPHSEVGELLRLLWLRGVSRAHLMPTIDNVTHALSSRWKWTL
jgi:hypothetical protein